MCDIWLVGILLLTFPFLSCEKMASKLQWRTAVSPTATVVEDQMKSTELLRLSKLTGESTPGTGGATGGFLSTGKKKRKKSGLYIEIN